MLIKPRLLLIMNAVKMRRRHQLPRVAGSAAPLGADAAPAKASSSAASGATGKPMKAQYLRAGSNRLRWVREKVDQKIFEAHWESAKANLAGYPTKHHFPTHHKKVRPIYLYEEGRPPAAAKEREASLAPLKPAKKALSTARKHKCLLAAAAA